MTNIKKLTTLECAYIAGFLDGDGCINAQLVRREDYVLKFQIRYTITFFQKKKRRWLLLGFQKQMSCGTFRTRSDDMCELAIVGSQAVKELLTQCLPYIKGKKRQARLLLFLINKSSPHQSKEEFLRLCRIVDHFAFLNDSKGRTITSQVVKERLSS